MSESMKYMDQKQRSISKEVKPLDILNNYSADTQITQPEIYQKHFTYTFSLFSIHHN